MEEKLTANCPCMYLSSSPLSSAKSIELPTANISYDVVTPPLETPEPREGTVVRTVGLLAVLIVAAMFSPLSLCASTPDNTHIDDPHTPTVSSRYQFIWLAQCPSFVPCPSLPGISFAPFLTGTGVNRRMLFGNHVGSSPYLLKTDIQVVAKSGGSIVAEGFERSITPKEVETSAGTFGDLPRFIQTMPGVVSDNDERNDFLVRGGNPSEDLFVVDNIDVPSINQLALSDTTGGFISMLDEDAIQHIEFHTDAYDDRFDERLSSVLEISTRTKGVISRRFTTEAGIAGVGGSIALPFGKDGSLFLSARDGILQYLTNNIGMDGVPHYRNAFIRAQNNINNKDSWWGMSLTGIDSITISPDAEDSQETNPYNIAYAGWRNTTGANWQHLFSDRALGIVSLAHAAQNQSVIENGQLQDGAIVYNENTTDQITTLKYSWSYVRNRFLTVTAGGRAAVDQLDYRVAQPIGLQNPYSENPAPENVMAMDRQFAPFSSGAYLQAMSNFKHGASVVVGERVEQWALGGHAGGTSKVLLSIPIMGKLAHIGYSQYEQLPPTLYLLSFNNLQNLRPIRSNQITGGVVLADNHRAHVTLEAYQKRYLDYPVASNYPQLSLANITDTFGQAFLMTPMVGRGTGIAYGAELGVQAHVTSHLDLTGSLVYARSWYAGLDGILRRGNYDVPLQVNLMGSWATVHRMILSWRYTATSGVPYTPDNMPLSIAQNRDVYNLLEVNAVRAPSYQRLDFRLEQSHKLGRGEMTWHAGLENALNRKNFYEYLWEPRKQGGGLSEQTQMPIFPDGGVKYTF